MNRYITFYKNLAEQICYIIIIPAFFLGFILIYTPFSIRDYYNIGSYSLTFHIMMLVCIMMGVLLISRLILYALIRHIKFTWIQYILWCAGETFATAAFHALYTTLFYHGEIFYFTALALALKHTYLIVMYPYIIFILGLAIHNYRVAIQERLARMEDSKLVKFFDEHKRLKLSITPNSLLFIQAEANYVKISYMDNDKEKSFLLRCSMKSLEETMKRCGMIRCHRSYYVNPLHIRVLSRGKEGQIVAEMKTTQEVAVPVSRQDFEALSDLL